MSPQSLRDEINTFIEKYYPDEPVILYDGFDEALIGFGASYFNKPCAIYNYEKCIELIMKNDSACEFQESDESDFLTYEDAIEYFEFNVIGMYVGDHTPIFMRKFDRMVSPPDLFSIPVMAT
ncbi:hypothetical protein EBS67_00375 [bacterium]|nr:hypothetical protein [bacterium]NBT60205.1 hypothetical protein [Planctomycetia bacterium]